MYIVRDYMTDEIVAVTTRKEDAVAMLRSSTKPNDPKLIIEKK